MPVVAFTIGAFGDIITIVQLGQKVLHALCDSTGSSHDYQALVAELASFLEVVEGAEELIDTPKTSGNSRPRLSGRLPKRVRGALQREIDESRELLEVMNEKIVGYQQSLQKGGSHSRMRDSWRKIGWSLFKKDELVGCRQRLSEHTTRINALIGQANAYVNPQSHLNATL